MAKGNVALFSSAGRSNDVVRSITWHAGILIALNRFLQETHGSKMAFLDGAPPERQVFLRKPP